MSDTLRLEFTFNTPIVGVDPRTGGWTKEWFNAVTADFKRRLYEQNAITNGNLDYHSLWVDYLPSVPGGTQEEIVAHVQACVAAASDPGARGVFGAMIVNEDSLVSLLREAEATSQRRQHQGPGGMNHDFVMLISQIGRMIQVNRGDVGTGLFPLAQAAGIVPEASLVVKEPAAPWVPKYGILVVNFPSDLLPLSLVTSDAGEYSSDLMLACTQSLRHKLAMDGVYDIRIWQRLINIYWRWGALDPAVLEAHVERVLKSTIASPVDGSEPLDRTGMFFPFHKNGTKFTLEISSGPSNRN